MKAIQPFTLGLAPADGLPGRPAQLFRGFSGGLGVKVTTILAEIFGCHAALIKKWRRG
jgi:hypothetical protein